MHELYDLKEMLCKKLEEYSRKGEITTNSLDIIDKLAHAVKNIDKVIEMSDEGGYNSRGGMSYARDGRGSYARRDRMGRYSRGKDSVTEMAMTLGEMMGELPEELKGDAERFMRKLDSMR